MIFQVLVICSFYELRKSFTIFLAIYIVSMALVYHPHEDYWTTYVADSFVYTLVGLLLAIFLQSVMSIAFIKSKAAEIYKNSIISLYNKVPDAVIVLQRIPSID